jgi:hypothetical protein
MRNFQKPQAKKILTALGDARRALAIPPALSRTEHARRQKIKRAREKALASALTKAGLDLAPLKALKPARQDPRRQWQRHTAGVAKQSALAARTFRRSIDKRRAMLEGILTSQLPPFPFPGLRPYYVVLDTPFLITRTFGMVMDDSQVEPWNSWAKVRAYVPVGQSAGSVELSFYHVWENPSDFPVTVDAHSYLVLNGGAVAFVDGGFFPDSSRYSDLAIDVHLYPLEWWNQPPTSPLAQPDQSQNAMSLHQGGTGWLGDLSSNEQEQDVFRGYDLSYRSWAIPPKAFTVFETSMSLTYSNNNGGLLADFSENQFSVMSAAVVLLVAPSLAVVLA